ncbi:hypothetical protein CRUP_024377 [Coryphaenoides rupestris]|nr:hypothetical protein CRUP_024377 [Coryphaenoides rupestris]
MTGRREPQGDRAGREEEEEEEEEEEAARTFGAEEANQESPRLRLGLCPPSRGLCSQDTELMSCHQAEWVSISGPPSAPENAISTVNETCVTLEWSPPRDTGGRGDVSYGVRCQKCAGDARKCAPCGSSVHFVPRQFGLSAAVVLVSNLQPDSNYSFAVESQSGVSDLSPAPRGAVVVNVTTSQTVSVVLKERRSRDSVTLAWQGPDRPNGVIVEYEVIYYEKADLADRENSPSRRDTADAVSEEETLHRRTSIDAE